MFFIDVSEGSERNPVEDLDSLKVEVAQFGQGLATKRAVVAANKIDVLVDGSRLESLERRAQDLRLEFWSISAATGAGTQQLVLSLERRLRQKELNAIGQTGRGGPG